MEIRTHTRSVTNNRCRSGWGKATTHYYSSLLCDTYGSDITSYKHQPFGHDPPSGAGGAGGGFAASVAVGFNNVFELATDLSALAEGGGQG